VSAAFISTCLIIFHLPSSSLFPPYLYSSLFLLHLHSILNTTQLLKLALRHFHFTCLHFALLCFVLTVAFAIALLAHPAAPLS
jgi:hypothetical protein